MTRLLSALLLTVTATMAPAETVSIRSGEHPDFSRLVLSIPEGSEWRLGREGAGYILDLGRSDLDYDVTGVFERLPESRIGTLRGEDGRLLLEPDCACHAQAFLWRTDRLVIDVADGPAPPASRFEEPVFVSAPDPAPREEPAILAAELSDLPTILPAPVRDPMLAGLEGPAAAPPNPEAIAPDLTEFERAVIESLGRAASQGLLDPAIDSPRLTALPATGEEVTAEAPETVPLEAGAARSMEPATSPGITTRTIKDPDRQDPPAPVTAAGLACIEATEVDVAAWADTRPFHDQIAPIRAALSSERDRILSDEALGLARLYIHFGFGREALHALDLAADRSQTHQVLRTMAYIVDGHPAPEPVFDGQIACRTDVALWALLAKPEFESGAWVSAPRILQSLRRLPPALRGHLGVDLAARFAAIGEDGAAETALSIAREGYTADTTASGLVEVDVDTRRGEADAALQTLTDLAAVDPRLPPARLVELIDLLIEEGRPVPLDLIALAAAQRFEAKDRPVADALLRAEIRALDAAGRYEESLALIASDGDDLTAEMRLDHGSQTIIALSESAEDDRFLAVAFSGALPMEITATARNALARRLLSLGFPAEAQAQLRGPARHDAARERRYLRAEAALALTNPETTLRLLSGMTDDRALNLIAMAHGQAGDHRAALAAAGARPDRPVASDIVWRAAAWARLRETVDPLLSDVAARLDRPEGAAPAPDTLAQRRAILDDSAQTRDLVSGLLDRFQVEPGATPGGPAIAHERP